MAAPQNDESPTGKGEAPDTAPTTEAPSDSTKPTPYRTGAQAWYDAGLEPVPVEAGGKGIVPPGFMGRYDGTVDAAQVVRWMRDRGDHNLCLRLTDLIVIDVDNYANKTRAAGVAATSLRELQDEWGDLPPTYLTSARLGPEYDGVSGCRFYRLPAGRDGAYLHLQHLPRVWSLKKAGIDLCRRGHRQTVVWPSAHHTGRTYQTLDQRTGEVSDGPFRFEDVPELPEAWVLGLLRDAPKPKPAKRGRPSNLFKTLTKVSADYDEDLTTWLTAGKPCKATTAAMTRIGKALASGESRYDVMVPAQLALTRLGEQGHTGAATAMEWLHDEYLKALGGERDGEDEWQRALDGVPGVLACEGLTHSSDYGCCGGKPAGDDRPELCVNNHADAAQVLRNTLGTGVTSPLFVRSVKLVHVPRAGQPGFLPLTDDPEDMESLAQVWPMDGLGLAAYLDDCYYVYTEHETESGAVVQVHEQTPHFPITARLAAQPRLCRNLRELRGVVHTPVMREDWTVADEPGYDEGTKTLYLPETDAGAVSVPLEPTPAEVLAARSLVFEMLAGFPFVTESDRANFVAAMLAPLLRRVLPTGSTLPMLALNAPMMGTGKSLLAKVLIELYGGVMRSKFSGDDEELRKQITTILLRTTGSVVVWDNVIGLLKSATLAEMLTVPTWTDRKLGANDEARLANDRLWCITGNNINIGGELQRRMLWVTIDANRARPQDRTDFRIKNLEGWVLERRVELVGALLTMLRAWVVAGRPVRAEVRSDSFAAFQSYTQGVIDYCGIGGNVMANDTDLAEIGADDEDWAEFLDALEDVFGEDPFLTADVLKRANFAGTAPERALYNALPSDVLEKVHRDGGTAAVRTLGVWFKNRNRRWAGLKCAYGDRKSKTKAGVKWRIGKMEPVEAGVTPVTDEAVETMTDLEKGDSETLVTLSPATPTCTEKGSLPDGDGSQEPFLFPDKGQLPVAGSPASLSHPSPEAPSPNGHTARTPAAVYVPPIVRPTEAS